MKNNIPFNKLTAGEKKFAKRWGVAAIILASFLTLCIVLLLSGAYTSSRNELVDFKNREIAYEEALSIYNSQLAVRNAAEDAYQKKTQEISSQKSALENLKTARAEALNALAEQNAEAVEPYAADCRTQADALDALKNELAALESDKAEIESEIAAIENRISEQQKNRSSITRKALTQHKNALKDAESLLASYEAKGESGSAKYEQLKALAEKLTGDILAFEEAISLAQEENNRLKKELTKQQAEKLNECCALIEDKEAEIQKVSETLGIAEAAQSAFLEEIAAADSSMIEKDSAILEAEKALDDLKAEEKALKEDFDNQNIEANRLRVLYSKAETNKDAIGISRVLAYAKKALTSPIVIAPAALLTLLLAVLLLKKFRFVSRAADSYQSRLGDESQKRVRSSLTVMSVLLILIILAVSLIATGEYDRAGARLEARESKKQAITDAEALVKKTKNSIGDYDNLILLIESEAFSGKDGMNSKQKRVYQQALKATKLKEAQLLPGAEGREEAISVLEQNIRSQSAEYYATLENAEKQLAEAKEAYSGNPLSVFWSKFVRFEASNIMLILYVAEFVMLVAITCCACFKNRTSISGTLFNVNNYILVSLCAFITIAPFFYVVGASFATEYELQTRPMFIIPQDFSIDAYKYIASSNKLLRSMGNSVFITVAGTAINLFFTMTMAYVLSKRYLHGRNFFLNMVIVSMFFSGGMIPGYILVSSWLKMKNTYWSVLLPGAISAYNLMIVKNFFQGLPQELEESARIDGCNEIGTLLKIVLPLSLPVIATFGLFYAVGHWNSYFSAMIYMTGASEKWPLQVILREIIVLSEASAGDLAAMDPNFVEPPQQSIKMAVIVVSTVPIMCVYPFLQKYFVKGVMVGALKG